MPDLKHAELLGGFVHIPSPVSSIHSRVHISLCDWLGAYERSTPGCERSLDATWLISAQDVPQPDLALHISDASVRQSTERAAYLSGVPELVVEVAVSSSDRDLGPKRKVYECAGIREYLVALKGPQRLIWYELRDGEYQTVEPDTDGIFRSRCFPGLWLHSEALWARDAERLFPVVRKGLATPEHAAFVSQLWEMRLP